MTTGYQANVVANTPILASWGNLIRDRTVMVFASTAERDAAIPAPQAGMICYVVGQQFPLRQYGGATTGWTPIWSSAWGSYFAAPVEQTSTNVSGDTIGSGEHTYAGLVANFTPPAGRRLNIRAQVPVLGGGAVNGIVELRLYNGAAQIATERFSFPTTATAGMARVEKGSLVTTGAAVAIGVRSALITGGGSTYTTQMAGGMPGLLVVTDLGPSAAPA